MALDPEQDKRYVGPAPDEETQQKTVQWDLVRTLGRQLHLLQFNIVGKADVPFSTELPIHRLWHPNYRLPLFLWKPFLVKRAQPLSPTTGPGQRGLSSPPSS